MGAVMNKVILMGRLVKDPDIKYTATNKQVCNFTLAVDRQFKRQGEERKADFISCQAWGKVAEFINNYFTKGRKIAVEGTIQTRTWDDTDGKKHFVTEVIVSDVYFADSKKQEQGDAYEPEGFEYEFDEKDLPF